MVMLKMFYKLKLRRNGNERVYRDIGFVCVVKVIIKVVVDVVFDEGIGIVFVFD